MKIRYLFYISLLLFCSSCIRSKQTAGGDAEKFRIKIDLTQLQQASPFDYFKQIELIPLETNDDALIGARFGKVVYHQSRYYVMDAVQFIVLVFDETGKFIYKIDKRGQGPGEYFRIDDMIINPFTGNIDLLNTFGFIHSYDLSGNPIRSIQVAGQDGNYEFRAVHKLFALNENIYVLSSEYNSPAIFYFDVKEKKIIHREYERKLTMVEDFRFYEYSGQNYLYCIYDNSTYLVGLDSLVKAYTWDFGKLNYDIGKMSFSEDFDTRVEELNRLPYRIYYQSQNNKYIIARLCLKNSEIVSLIYDKSTQKYKYYERFTDLKYLIKISFH